MANPDIIYPLARGDFIIRKYDHQVARVRSIFWDEFEKEFCMNLSLYRHSGDEPGRLSPTMGGPSNFEPAIPFTDEWERIKPPNFPIKVGHKWVPDGEGKFVSKVVAYVEPLPFRKLKRAPKKNGRKLPAPRRTSDYDPQLEAASMRMTAQNLRDLARTMPEGDVAGLMCTRAKELEDNAERISPRVLY